MREQDQECKIFFQHNLDILVKQSELLWIEDEAYAHSLMAMLNEILDTKTCLERWEEIRLCRVGQIP